MPPVKHEYDFPNAVIKTYVGDVVLSFKMVPNDS
jgi:hypothetical protein